MKTWKRKCALFLVFTMIMTLSPIGEKNAQAKAVKKTATVKVGKTKKLLIVGGQNARKIKWSVKNKKIARIIKKSKKSIWIKGVKAGSTLILGRAYIGGKIKKLKIKVKVEKASKKEMQKMPEKTVSATSTVRFPHTSVPGLTTTGKPNEEVPLSTKRPIKAPTASAAPTRAATPVNTPVPSPALTPSALPSSAPSEVPTPSSVPTQTAEPTPDPTVEPTPRPTPDINPPENYLSKQDGVSYGSKRSITYYSTTTGKDRKANIIFPAGYTTEKKYPVLYLFHGVGGTENEWFQGGKPNEIVSNLVAQGSAREMILVFPNIRCRANDEDTEMSLEAFQAFDNFINDLRDNLMPYIESHYSVATGRENTAIAGLSMGGREALYIGLSMAEKIGYVGVFEPAVGVLPYDREPGLFTEDTMKLPEEYNDNTYIMIVKGNEDTTVGEWPRTYHQTLEKNGVPHTYYEMPGPHSFTVWNNGLYNFARVIF